MSEFTSKTEARTRSSAANKRLKFIVAGAVIAVAVVYLVFTATQSTAAYFLTVEELQDMGGSIYGRNLRVSGKVVGDSIDYNSQDLILRFQVAGESGQLVPVVFNGPKPDQLRHDAEAILAGKYDGNEFTAQTVLLKCPSRYEEEGITEEEVEAVR
jgi:cytochrome c-type biogenesis protein CcmE